MRNGAFVAATAAILILTSLASATVDPVAHWPFDSNANDIEGGNDGTFVGGAAITNTPGEYRIGTGALTLDGVGDYVEANAVCSEITQSNFTLSAWIKSNSIASRQFITAIETGSGRDRMLLGHKAGSPNLFVYDYGWEDTSTVVIDNTWHHIAYTLDDVNNQLIVYVDGTAVLTLSENDSVFPNYVFSLGQQYDSGLVPSDYFIGQIDDVRIYDRKLSDAEILAIASESVPTYEPNIGLSASSFNFSALPGGANPTDQTLEISNTGDGSINWNITESCSWLTVTPLTGSSTGETDDVTLSVDITGLAAGSYSCDITISDPLAYNNPQTVTVSLYIFAPVIHWPFDSDANDIEGGFHGTFENGAAITNTPGEYRIGTGAVALDGIDGYVEITGYKGIGGSGSRTCSAWIKTDQSDVSDIMTWGGTGSTGGSWIVQIETGKLRVYLWGSHKIGTTTINDGQWHHIAVVMPQGGSSDDIELYVDGFPEATTSGSDIPITTGLDTDMIIGGIYHGGNYIGLFNGQIDDVWVYNRELSDAEILAMQDERPIGDSVIGLSVSSFDFFAALGGPNPADQILTSSNIGGGTLNWNIIEDCPWLTVSPLTGSSTGETDDVTLSVDITGLAVGSYSCDITISDPLAYNNPQTVTVNLDIRTGILLVPSEYTTIQSAINAAVNGDTIIVSPGTYYENISIGGKDITLTSTDPESSEIVQTTIIDGSASDTVVRFAGSETSACELTGFTITNGYENGGDGGGIDGNETLAKISHCIIKNNVSEYGGGGIDSVNGTIYNCLVIDNESGDHEFGAGGIYGYVGVISNCTITGNLAPGINWGDEATITNCIIWGNTGGDISNAHSSTVTYSCVGGGHLGTGNISADPLFISGSGPSGGFYLSQTDAGQGSNSLCVDTGSDTSENLSMDALTTRIDHISDTGIVDMGFHYSGNVIIPDDDGILNVPSEYPTIQAAIDNAMDGNTVMLATGTYYENVSINGKNITIKSINPDDPATVAATIINGSDLDSVVTVTNVTGETVFEGLKITNGKADHGGGIYADSTSELKVISCVVTGNSTADAVTDNDDAGNGGGIYGTTVTLLDSTVSGNSTGDGWYYGNGGAGAGIYCTTLTLLDSTVSGNITGRGGRTGIEGYGGHGGAGAGVRCATANISGSSIINNRGGTGGRSDYHPGTGGDGGGIYCSVLNISDSVISGNSAGRGGERIEGGSLEGKGGDGGGVYCTSGTFEDVVISGNSAGAGGPADLAIISTAGDGGHGGGVYCETADFFNVLFESNSAGDGADGSSGTIFYSYGGDGGNGGGVYFSLSSSPQSFGNCTFTLNQAGQRGLGTIIGDDGGHGADGSGGGIYASTSTSIIDSVLWSNTPDQLYGHSCGNITYSDIAGSLCSGSSGNISSDPLFVTGSLGDYYLSQIAAGQGSDSLCVDAGSDTVTNLEMDLHTTRIDEDSDSGVVDMGYHYDMPSPADIDGDGLVSVTDLEILALQWLSAPSSPSADIWPIGTGDGIVNLADLALLARAWMW